MSEPPEPPASATLTLESPSNVVRQLSSANAPRLTGNQVAHIEGRLVIPAGGGGLHMPDFTIYDELWDIDGSERTANIEGDADL